MLLNNQSPEYNPPWYPFSPIKVTSPDQFVPLYLAYAGPVSPGTSSLAHVLWTPSPTNLWMSQTATENIRKIKMQIEDRIETDVEGGNAKIENLIREEFLRILDHPYPSQYGFPLPMRMVLGPWTVSSNDIHQITAGDAFQRGYFAYDPFRIIGPGVIIKTTYNPYQTMGNNIYNSQIIASRNWFRDSTVVLLITIKAKLIPKVRARLFLGLPFELNLSDVRYMRCVANDARLEQILRHMGGEFLNQFLKNSGITEEWPDQKVMQSYLWNPKPQKTPKQIVEDAIKAAEQPGTVPELV